VPRLKAEKITRLIHNGVIVPKYEAKGFSILHKGKRITLSPGQEEMAVAWVRKLGTEYASDPVFVSNFLSDFCKALGLSNPCRIEEFDFSEVQRWLEAERLKRESVSKEEKKALAAERKKIREANKEKYGYATVNEHRVELGNYTVEPACIFMGRGQHPLRGRWKPAATYSDITLNLSPDAPVPPLPDGSKWKEIVFNPDYLWIARWDDKLRGVEKYIWFADTAEFKQERDIEKYDLARQLEAKLGKVRRHIEENLGSSDPMRRKIATVSYLIDNLKMRVGDEKDEDEADTVGATTLRSEHIKISGGDVTFDFLGKDSVRWLKTIEPPSQIVENLKEWKGTKRKSLLFEGIRSEKVNAFLDEVMPGLTAKVFRTYHATKVVKDHLSKAEVKAEDEELLKKSAATMANLQAAIECNHKRKLPKNWNESMAKKLQRLKELRSKGRKKQAGTLTTRIKLLKATRDYNLGTSLRSYIDPRTYAEWGRRVDYDWKKYYSKTLQRKFGWVDRAELAQAS
jgi:DNA topoisomerase-1